MKIRIMFIALLLLCCIPAALFYTQARQVEGNQQVITEAMKNKDTPLLIDALISRMKEQLEIDEERFPALITEVENYTQSCTDTAGVAVLHSMLAEMYTRYYQQNRWTIDQRLPIVGYVPENIREWTANLFQTRIREELDASLADAPLLQQTSALRFKAILTVGKDASVLRPTLYDFLAFRAIAIQPSDLFYRELIAFRNTQPDKKAALLAELDYLQYQYGNPRASNTRTLYNNSLDSLMQIYAAQPYSIEITIAQLDLQEKSRYANNNDSILAGEYKMCTEAIARYPHYERINVLKNRLKSMEQPILQVQTNNTVYPGRELTIKVNYKNISQLKVRIYACKQTPQEAMSGYYRNKQASQSRGQLIKETTFTLTAPNNYTQRDTVLTLPMEALGLYECVITTPKQNVRAEVMFSVSRLAALLRNSPSGQTEVLVTDFLSGKPVHDATVNYFGGKGNTYPLLGSVKTNREGLAPLPRQQKATAYQATLPGDSSSMLSQLYQQGRGRQPIEQTSLSLFTDRGIYRPGQTIHFKGLAYVKDTEDPHIITRKTFTVILRDANRREVASQQFTTDQMGAFNGSFTLPRQTLSGTFTLSSENSTAYIEVAEYKRPTFSLELLPIKEEVSFASLLRIAGKAQTYSGVSLQSGTVTYRIQRIPWFRGYMGRSMGEQVAEGTTTMSTDGSFSFTFQPEKEAGEQYAPAYQRYEVIASLTDSKGETQEARSFFSVGETGMLLSILMPEQMERDSAKAKVTAQTINGEPVTATGTYTIRICREPIREGAETTEGSIVAEGRFSTTQDLEKQIFANLPSGRYRLSLTSEDTQGRTVKAQQDFILYGKQDKRPPVFVHTWLLPEQTECLPGEEACFVFGSSDKKAYILYELFNSNSQLIKRERIELNDENRTFRIPFMQGYGAGIVASFTFVKEGKLYNTQLPIYRKAPDRTLTIKPETFRNHLLPGSRETWKFHIQDADSVNVEAAVLAGMYDASLDQIQPFQWSFQPVWRQYLNAPRFAGGAAFEKSNRYDAASPKFYAVQAYQYDNLNWQGIMDYNNYRLYRAGGIMAKSMASVEQSNESLKADKGIEIMQPESLEESAVTADAMGMMPPAAPRELPQLRENFNETAFFFPALASNEAGDVSFNFTLPESNTTWKLQMLAYTEDLKYGMITREVISQKPLMVLPNLPRFLRQGDEVSISSQLMNQSGQTASGRIRIEWFDPENDQPVICLTKSEKPFTLATDSMTTVSWHLTVPKNISLIGCRIIAECEQGSDGEQQLIPVLPNELLITESIPFYLMGEGEKRIQLPNEKSSATRRPFSMTLEMSSNPIWYAVQALPTLTTPQDHNILSWLASYYSNTLAPYIVQANPRLRTVIQQWTAQGGTAATLFSNLEKNEELKAVLLAETPWVLAAANETEQKTRLSLLFDLNRADGAREAALQQLLKQQQPDGGWSWMQGAPSSQTITLQVLKGMSNLVKLNAVEYNQQEKEMQIKALTFVDKTIRQDYEQLQKQKNREDTPLTAEQVEYLYVRSAYRDIPEPGDAREAIRFYTAQAEKQWSKLSLYGKAETALLMHRNGKKEVTAAILAWLRKTATVNETQGMYWANNRRGTDYFSAPVDTHCLLMALFNEVTPDKEEADRMKQWLLNQKQTQNWESVPATVNAIYALLLTGDDWLTENNTCTVQWGKQTFSTASGETATGYLKEVMQANQLTKDMQTLHIQKSGKAPAWGAVYNQYFEAIDQVKAQSNLLSIQKKLFIESNSGSGLQIHPVTPETPLRVGDKVIVRLTLSSQREMNYVALKDLRAGCFEPSNQLAGYTYKDGLSFYRAPGDVSENFYFDRLPKGTFVIEYAVYVSRSGEYAGGISTLQCLYAPEFVSHTAGEKIQVNQD